MMDSFKTCLNLSTLGYWDFETQLRIASWVGFKTVGVRMNILQNYLSQGHTLNQAKQLCVEFGIDPLEMNFFPNWLFCSGDKRKEIFAKFREFASVAQGLGCRILVCPTGYDDLASKDLGTAVENYREICALAAEYQQIAGLEFVPWSEVGTVKKAWEIVKEVDSANGGLVVDCFHYFQGNSAESDLEAVPIEKVVMVHLTDIEPIDTDILTLCRNHRVLPGEGVYNFDPILKYLFDRNYQGYYNLEIMNAGYAKQDPLAIAKKAKQTIDLLLDKYSQKAIW
jgi:2-keto-myo-inositol isomerase